VLEALAWLVYVSATSNAATAVGLNLARVDLVSRKFQEVAGTPGLTFTAYAARLMSIKYLGLQEIMADTQIQELLQHQTAMRHFYSMVRNRGRPDQHLLQHCSLSRFAPSGSESWLRNLIWFDQIPESTTLLHNKRNHLLSIEQGNELSTVFVGNIRAYVSCAQVPPAANDSWEYGPFWLQRGIYEITVCGGTNSHHGKLRLLLDEIDITPELQDWFGQDTQHQVEQVVAPVLVHHSGRHTLRGEVPESSNTDYWMCLNEIEFVQVGTFEDLDDEELAAEFDHDLE